MPVCFNLSTLALSTASVAGTGLPQTKILTPFPVQRKQWETGLLKTPLKWKSMGNC